MPLDSYSFSTWRLDILAPVNKYSIFYYGESEDLACKFDLTYHILETEECSRRLDVELFILAVLVEVLDAGSDYLGVCAGVSTAYWRGIGWRRRLLHPTIVAAVPSNYSGIDRFICIAFCFEGFTAVGHHHRCLNL